MGVCGAGCIVAAALALRAVDAGAARTWAALLAFGVSPLVLGSLFDTRFDLWPTLLAVGALAALVYERPMLSGGLLGLGFAAKIWPAVLVPIAVAYLWRRRGRRSALIHVAAFAVVAIACFLPFVILAPHGVRAMFADQLDRPLQVESLGAAVLMAAQHFGMAPLQMIDSHGGQALSGRGAGLAADLSTLFEVASVGTIWIVFARRRHPDAEAVLLASAAAVAALVAFDRVLSPQYLIWIVPFVPLVSGRTRLLREHAPVPCARPDADVVPAPLLAACERPRLAVVVVPARARPRARRDRRPAPAGAQPRMRFRSRKRRFAGRSASRRMR